MMRIVYLLLIIGSWALPGCVAGYHEPDTLCLSASLSHGERAWLAEARKRFDNPFILTVHGAAFHVISEAGVHDEWWTAPDKADAAMSVEAAAWLLHSIYPDRDVVLICCDVPGRTKLGIPRVWHAPGFVLSIPAMDARADWIPKGVSASIWAFTDE